MAFPDLSTYGGFQAAIGFAGQIANMNPIATENLTNESATAIDFGIAVARGTSVANAQLLTCKPVAVEGDVIIGISLRHLAYGGALRTPIGVNGVVGYPQYDSVPVCREGDIFCIPFENVVVDSQVVSLTAQLGRLGGGTPGTGRKPIFNGVWLTTTLAGAVGIVRLNG